MTIKTTRLAASLAAAGLIFAAGGLTARHADLAGLPLAAANAGQAAPAANDPAPPATAASASSATGATPIAAPEFTSIVRRYGPAVVNISVEGTRPVRAEGMGPGMPFPFPFPFGPNGAPQGRQPAHGLGSGFIVSADGLILTNAHVVDGADTVTVKLTDRREFRAKVLGADKRSDVAVLRIDAKNLPTVRLGDPASLQVGEWVLAIGSPYGLENSVSAGVVSATGRSLPDESIVPFIQTDVAVNPGNSGGPLFNARGEVVGINSQIYSRTGGWQGLSFAVPIDLATRVRDQIVATGHASHARLGVTIQEVNQALAESFGLDRPEGALVADVEAGGPAAKAGLKAGDVIRRLDDRPIVASGDLPALLGRAKPGDTVRMEIVRGGKTQTVQARLADADGDRQAAGDDAGQSPATGGKLGLAVRPLTPQERSQGQSGGLVVEQAGGRAAAAGIQPGDVLLAVNGQPVTDVAQLRGIVAGAKRSVALLVQRGEAQIFVPVPLG